MSWIDHLRPASFRGVPFHVDVSSRSGGRRGVLHEYPGRDTPFWEDMGRKGRRFAVEAYIVGRDYHEGRDALLAALEAEGAGELVHPYHGTRRVVAVDFRVQESPRDGGLATFSLEFAEAPAVAAQPAAVADTAGAVRASAAAVREVSVAEFLASYSPGIHLASLSDALRSAALAANAAAATVQAEAQTVARMKQRVDDLANAAGALVGLPGDVASSLVALLGGFPSRRAVLAVYTFNPGPRPPATTSNRAQERVNFDALQRLTQRLTLARAAELVLEETFDTYDAALAAREAITALVDDQVETATDDTFPSLVQLRADVVGAVPGPAADLPRLVPYTPPVPVPSLVLAHRLYGNVDRELELVARNRVPLPGLIPGGAPLEVLSRG